MDKKILAWSDGGCRGNGKTENVGGWGVYLTYGDYTKKISGSARNTTNNKMELQGCIELLKAIKKKDVPTIVYLDSNYVMMGITQWISGWKKKGWKTSDKKDVKNKDLWIELDELKSQFTDIKFCKVKGHSGEKGNEIVDTLCNIEMDKLEKGEFDYEI